MSAACPNASCGGWTRLRVGPRPCRLLSRSCAAPFSLRRIEKALRRFRKATNNVGHLRLLRNRKTFESAHDKKIRKTKESAMRQARARRSARSRAASGF